MEFEIRELERKDHRRAVDFAITGMHFDWYLDNRVLLKLYGTYFLYSELERATEALAAYAKGRLAGVLLAEVRGGRRKYRSFWRAVYVKLFEGMQRLFFREGADVYERANQEMLAHYRAKNDPDGEILFLAADQEKRVKGTGTALLREFERREKGKLIYLYTDSACTYQFYERRGFAREGEKEIVLKLGRKRIKLECYLYSRRNSG